MANELQRHIARLEKLESSSIGLKIDTGQLSQTEEDKRGFEVVDLISNAFNLGEMKELALELGIELENITGTTRREKAVSLVAHYIRRNDLDTLIHWCSGKRRNIKWPKTKLDKENFDSGSIMENNYDNNSISI